MTQQSSHLRQIEAVVDEWVDRHDSGDLTDDETLAVFAFIGDVLRPAIRIVEDRGKPVMREYPPHLLKAVAQTIIDAHAPTNGGVSYHRLAHQVLDVVATSRAPNPAQPTRSQEGSGAALSAACGLIGFCEACELEGCRCPCHAQTAATTAGEENER